MVSDVKVKKGYLVLYFCFDVGSEIHLDKVATVLGKAIHESKLECNRLTQQYVQYRIPPLQIKLDEKKISDVAVPCSVDLKLYDFGVITVRYWIPIKGDFEEIGSICYNLVENNKIEAQAKKEVQYFKEKIKELIEQPAFDVLESYAIVYVQELDKNIPAKSLFKKYSLKIAKFLRPEKQHLSKEELADAIKNPLSYFENDLTIIDWNAAFILDPTESYDVLDIVEYAVIELLELRTYDKYLDDETEKAYDVLSNARGLKAFKSLHSTLEMLAQIRLEVLEVMEKVENSLKLIGDLYLAKVYQSASQRFYLDKWKASVKSKLDTLVTTYTMLSDKIEASRNFILEFIIVMLFIIDIILLLTGL
ncbi:hypothetical protein HYV79_03155 [Candidatus Woesearchaeota archaeon]|nr:hypothetical protein [Candidatus Woesearchaeota archaeon]